MTHNHFSNSTNSCMFIKIILCYNKEEGRTAVVKNCTFLGHPMEQFLLSINKFIDDISYLSIGGYYMSRIIFIAKCNRKQNEIDYPLRGGTTVISRLFLFVCLPKLLRATRTQAKEGKKQRKAHITLSKGGELPSYPHKQPNVSIIITLGIKNVQGCI